MKRIDASKNRMVQLRTMKELKAEKLRLKQEIAQTESGIQENYHYLIAALSFRNIINTIAEEIIATNVLVSQAYTIIRPLFKRKKKKKRIEHPDTKEEGVKNPEP